MHKNMRAMEQYSDDQFVVKGVYKGEQSEAVLLFLKPGQEVPEHPHDRFEVVLLPQKGTGVMTVDGRKEVDLVPETLYYEPAGRTFKIKNTGDGPLQVLITLILVEPKERSLQVPLPAEAQDALRAEDTMQEQSRAGGQDEDSQAQDIERTEDAMQAG